MFCKHKTKLYESKTAKIPKVSAMMCHVSGDGIVYLTPSKATTSGEEGMPNTAADSSDRFTASVVTGIE